MTKVSSVGIITVLRILNITALPTAKTAFFDELEKHFSFCIRSEKKGDGKSQNKSLQLIRRQLISQVPFS